MTDKPGYKGRGAAPSPSDLANAFPAAASPSRGATRQLLADIVSPDIGLPGSTPRPLVDRLRSGVSVSDFGAVGDGKRDDTVSIQRALDVVSARGGGTLIVDPGVYRTTKAIRLRSRVAFTGFGPASTIYNDGSSEKLLERFAFFPGSHHPVAFDRRNSVDGIYDMLPLEPVEEGQSALAMREISAPWPLGTTFFAFVRSRGEHLRNLGGAPHSIPDEAFLAKVRVQGQDKLEMEEPAPFTVHDPHISPVAKRSPYLGDEWYCLHDASLTDITVRGHGIFNQGCAYRCRFTDLTLEDGAVGAIQVNAMMYVSFSRINASFSSSLVEIKSHSHAVRISEINGVCKSITEQFYPISVGEQSSLIEFDQCRCVNTREANAILAMVHIQGARAIMFRRCILTDFSQGPGPLIGIAGGASKAQPTTEITFDGCELMAPNRHHFIGIGYPPENVEPSAISLQNNTLDGSTRTGAAILINFGRDIFARGTVISPALRTLADEPKTQLVELATQRAPRPPD